MKNKADLSFAQIEHTKLIEEQYQKYVADPKSVESSWQHFFEGMEFSSLLDKRIDLIEEGGDVRILQLIEAYQRFGHLLADVNPISTSEKKELKQLELSYYGLDKVNKTSKFSTFGLLKEQKTSLDKIFTALKEIYCSKVGYEFYNLQDLELVSYIKSRVEKKEKVSTLTIEHKRRILNQLNKAELFETFLHTKFVGQKRFSLEGLETLIPILDETLNYGSSIGMEEFVVGMPHRGRLNVLSNIFNKSYSIIFHEFEESYAPGDFEGSGDVKYHKGFSSDLTTSFGKKIHISIAPNTSHLESVIGIVEGQIRAKQVLKEDINRTKIVPILIHGDAAFSGQGVVYEVMQFNKVEGYGNGGTVHIALDNQIGFTTLPSSGRSTQYCTDIAKTFDVPVFHVNAEDPEGCVQVLHLALDIRQKFHCDVIVHLNGYRKYGHNESDEPSYTQPIEYKKIRTKKSIRALYTEDLIRQGVLEKELAEELEEKFKNSLQNALDGTKEFRIKKPSSSEILGNRWDVWKAYKLEKNEGFFDPIDTKVPAKQLKELVDKFCQIPKGITPHRKVEQLFKNRKKMLEQDPKEKTIDWGLAEHLAFASLLEEKKHVRISGQDSGRGTFSHRHAIIIDQNTGESYYPLNNLSSEQASFHCYDSILSEFGALAFEYGYSISYRDVLVIWEAQFGDFSNGAQIIIDGYIATAEQKWNRLSSLVLLLPHGYEGQGAEHSSARIERFLQLSAEYNMTIVNPTTPSQIFHLFRRQVKHSYKKPLVVFTPKGLLRHKKCLSSLEDLSFGTFEEIIDDDLVSTDAKTVCFLTGKLYFDLCEKREELSRNDIAFIRLEQLYPLDLKKLKKSLSRYSKMKRCIWVQDEPENMGAWDYMRPILKELTNSEAEYIGRKRSASPATGSHKVHSEELKTIMSKVFS